MGGRDSVNEELQELSRKSDRISDLRTEIFNLQHELIFLKASADMSRAAVLLYHDGYVEVMSRHPIKAAVICVPPGVDPEDMQVQGAYSEHIQEGKVIASGFPSTMEEDERVDRACFQFIIQSAARAGPGNA